MPPSALDPAALGGATVQSALERGVALLRAAGIEGAEADAEWLLAAVLDVSRPRLALEWRRRLAAAEDERYGAWLRRRATREPLQHMLGTQAFRNLRLRVGPGALVPRPETEALVEWALVLLATAAAPRVVDVGTGTGCIACAIAAERPDATVVALERSPDALALARDNVDALGLAARVTVLGSDLFDALAVDVRADLVVANLPYLPSASLPTLPPEVRRFDPAVALDGGPDGLTLIRRLIAAAPARLVRGGALVLETAGGEQARAVTALVRAAGLERVETRRDLVGVERFVAGRRA